MASSDRIEDGLPKIEVSFPDQNFEGPLDLLLSLIQKHELDILNIPIAFITEKYLEFIRVMQLMNLDLASEYLVMAATLAHIKSKMLLPQLPADQEGEVVLEEEEDPREALIRRLLEYQKYKHAAEQLKERSTYGQDSFLRGAPLADAVDPGLPPLAEVPIFALAEAFQRVLDQTRVKLTHDIVADRISLTDRIHQLMDFLRGKAQVRFEALFTGVTTREGLVITFLALLEMAKLRMTRLYQEETLGPILVELNADASSPFESGAFDEPVPKLSADAPPDEPAKPIESVFEDDEPTADDEAALEAWLSGRGPAHDRDDEPEAEAEAEPVVDEPVEAPVDEPAPEPASEDDDDEAALAAWLSGRAGADEDAVEEEEEPARGDEPHGNDEEAALEDEPAANEEPAS